MRSGMKPLSDIEIRQLQRHKLIVEKRVLEDSKIRGSPNLSFTNQHSLKIDLS
jgi:hypothetical protein